MGEPTVSTSPAGAGDGTPEKRQRKRRRWGRGFLLALFVFGVGLGALGATLVKTAPGQRLVLDAGLEWIGRILAGSLTVGSIRSSSLLGEATLVGVVLRAEGDRRFLEADSVRLRYSLLSLFGAPARLASVTVFGPRVEIGRYGGEEVPNTAKLVIPRETADTLPGPGVALGSLRVVGGTLDVLTPLDGSPPPRVPTVASPDGRGSLRRIALEGLDLALEDVRLGGRSGQWLTGRLSDLSVGVLVLDRPLDLLHAEGAVRFGPGGLAIEGAEFRLPGSVFDGSLALGPSGEEDEGWGLGLELRTQGPAALSDLAWLDERVPEGALRGGISVSTADGVRVALSDVRVEGEVSRVTLNGGIRVSDGVTFQRLEVEAGPLALADLDPWIEGELPMDGWLGGSMALSGTPRALATEGKVTLVPTGFGGGPTTVDLHGAIHLGANTGVTGLHAVLDPLNYELVRALLPTVRLGGSGRAEVDASGRLREGLRLAADLRQGEDSLGSHVLVQGTVRRDSETGWVLDVRGDLMAVSLGLLHQVVPSIGGVGWVKGALQAVGPLSDLRLTGDVGVAEGGVSLDARVDLRGPERSVRLSADARDVHLSGIVPALPDPTRWTGHVEVDASAPGPGELEGRGALVARASRVAGLHLDTLATDLRISGHVLHVDSLTTVLGGVRMDGSGTVGLESGTEGELRGAFTTTNLIGLRPYFLGDTVIARDTLSVLERGLLRLQGVDVDTLPLLADVVVSGGASGQVVLSGNLPSLVATGTLRVEDAVWGGQRLGTADVRVEALDLASPNRVVSLRVDATDVTAYDWSFAGVGADVRLEGRAGEGSVSSRLSSGERYEAEGAFALDSVSGGEIRLDRVMLEVGEWPWNLVRPAFVRWDSTSVRATGLELVREGDEAMKVAADGTLAWGGTSDFHLTTEGLDLDHVARVAQREEIVVAGRLDASLDVTGPADAPAIDASFRIAGPRWKDMVLTSLEGALRFESREAELDLTAAQGSRTVLNAEGTVPVDLALRPRGRRVVPRTMDVRVDVDSLDAALALSYLAFLEDVDGAVSGDFRIRGDLDRIEPSGVLRLDDAAWSIEALGVRHHRVGGTLTLNPDRRVDVALDARAGGASSVRGTVTLEPLSDPRLDLIVRLRGFEAVSRRDVAGLLSGEARLAGSYRTPRVEGTMSVDQGTIFLEEFIRSTEVVDLTDPRIFQVVDTTVLSTRPLLSGIRNPFLQNLRVDVDLSVPQDAWLRSENMNVEIAGDLLVRYDRLNRDIVMIGELQARRGSYTVLGRRFDVGGGTVEFLGVPGINPTLNIQAVSRIRTVDGGFLDVNAAVEGTLTQPRVTLSSEDQGIAQSDLVSYLIFGRPSYELATGAEAWGEGAAGAFLGAAGGAGVTYLSGTLAARLGAALSRQIGLDYLSITQAGDFGLVSGSLAGSLAGTQVEVGQYLSENVFFALVFRPLTGQSTGQSFLGGARVEVALTDDYNVQAFWEDRFLRSRVGGFGDLGIQASQVVGIFIFREWGY